MASSIVVPAASPVEKFRVNFPWKTLRVRKTMLAGTSTFLLCRIDRPQTQSMAVSMSVESTFLR